jgi:hypothetical protein
MMVVSMVGSVSCTAGSPGPHLTASVRRSGQWQEGSHSQTNRMLPAGAALVAARTLAGGPGGEILASVLGGRGAFPYRVS